MASGYDGTTLLPPFWFHDSYDSGVRNSVFELVQRLNRYQSPRRETNIRCLRMYGGNYVLNFSPYSYARGNVLQLSDERPKYNVTSSCIDTVFSRIAKNKPRIMALTERGDDSLRRRAKKLTQFTLGMFKQYNVYQRIQEMFKDGCIFDLGALKIYRDGGKIHFDRVMPNELYIDEADGFYGTPSHIHQVKYVLKDVLKDQYPKKYHNSIDQAQSILEGESAFASNTDTRYAVVIESWHLKSGEEAKDGRHTICINNEVLFDEKWDGKRFPFVFSRWCKPVVGFWGQSLAYRLMGKQIEINKMLKVIQDSMHLGSSFKVFVEHNSRVVQEHLSNAIGSIVYYTGAKPEYTVPQTVHNEYFTHLKWLIESCYQEAGISSLSAQSKKPAGLDAAVAMREFQDIESERFATIAQDFDDLHIEVAQHLMELCKEIDADGEKLEVKAESKKFVDTIKWKDVEIEDNQVVLQLFPTAMLPHDPAGRIQYVTELMQGGLIDQDVGLGLLDFPDVQEALDVRNAPLNDILFTIGEILEESKYNPPEPYQNLALGIKTFQNYYLKARSENVGEAKLEMLRQWMAAAKAMMDKQAAEAQAMQTGAQAGTQAGNIAGGQPPGQPMTQPGQPQGAPAPAPQGPQGQ